MRKWNKLLALVLAMVMVFGLAATAFADEESDKKDTAPTESTDAAKDEDKTEGDKADAPDAAPAEGEDDKAPAEGEDDKAPAEGEDDKAPAEGEDDKAPAEDPYADVADWAKESVAAVVEKKLIDTTEDGFNPTGAMTRADVVVALYRLAESPANAEDAVNPFTDVADDAAYKDAVIWAYANKIVGGKTDTTFDPTGTIKRQEFAKIMYVYATVLGKAEAVEEDNLASFPDTVADWAKEPMNWAVANKLINGDGGKLAGDKECNRQTVATILNRYINEVLTAEPAAPVEGEGDKTPAEDEKTEGEEKKDDEKTEGDKADDTKTEGEGETEPKTEGDDAAKTEGETEPKADDAAKE